MTDNSDDMMDIFGIPKSEKEDREETASVVPFEESVKDLDMAESDVPQTKTLEVKNPLSIKESLENIVQETAPKDKEIDIPEKVADDIVEPIVEASDDLTELGIVDSVEEYSPPSDVTGELPVGEIKWQVVSSSARFEKFYEQKAEMIIAITHGKQIPFSKYRQELMDSVTDVSCRIFDGIEIARKMGNVQTLRNRVCQIQTDVNDQYFEWKRSVELMRGVLARTLYERGKQEGIEKEHMSDMEIYFSKLEALHRSAEGIEKNLDAAASVLSRQLNVCNPNIQRNFENQEGNIQKNVEYKSVEENSLSRPEMANVSKEDPEIAAYDDLTTGGGSAPNSPKHPKKAAQGTKLISWDEITAGA